MGVWAGERTDACWSKSQQTSNIGAPPRLLCPVSPVTVRASRTSPAPIGGHLVSVGLVSESSRQMAQTRDATPIVNIEQSTLFKFNQRLSSSTLFKFSWPYGQSTPTWTSDDHSGSRRHVGRASQLSTKYICLCDDGKQAFINSSMLPKTTLIL